jgi:hypothetical protein
MSSLPRLARAADAVVIALLVTSWVVAQFGGFSTAIADVRVSVNASWRLLLWAAAIAIARHVWIRRPSLPQRIVGAPRPSVSDDATVAPMPSRLGLHAGVIALFVALTCVVVFEQVIQMRGLADLGDPLFSVWRLDWVAHQIVRDPWHLFDANIFHPEPRTLAYSDAMLVPAAFAAPAIWLGADPVVVHNVLMLAASAFSGVTMFWLARELTRSTHAALVGGAIFALAPIRWALYNHLELQATVWMPLALLFTHRTFARGRWQDGILAGLAVALQSLSSLYYGVYLYLLLGVAGPLLAFYAGHDLRRAVRPLILGAALSAVLVLPVAAPYWANRATVGERSIGSVADFSARPSDYAHPNPRSRLYGGKSSGRLELFPGFVPPTLAAAALAGPWGAAGIAYTAGTLATADASFGVNGMLYPLLYRLLPPFRGLRAPDRFGVLVALALGVLAALGTTRVLGRVRSRRARIALTAGLIVLVALDAAPDLTLTDPWPVTPSIYDQLPSGADVVIVDLPFPIRRVTPYEHEYSYLQFATSHHRRMVNGGSGFYPPWYDALEVTMASFPSDASLEALRQKGARFLVLHGAFYEPADWTRVASALDVRRDVRLVATAEWNGAADRLYELLPR